MHVFKNGYIYFGINGLTAYGLDYFCDYLPWNPVCLLSSIFKGIFFFYSIYLEAMSVEYIDVATIYMYSPHKM